MNKTEPTTHMMKHKYLALATFVAAAFTFSGCKSTSNRTTAKKTNIVRTVVIHRAASPKSVSGKRISFDYSSAQIKNGTPNYNSGNYYVTWDAQWSNCTPHTVTSLKFKKNNQAKRTTQSADDYSIWTYKKTGDSTATVILEEHEAGDTYLLTFETPTTGTATITSEDDCCGYYKVVNIRFTIK